jgi:hypothetical protein
MVQSMNHNKHRGDYWELVRKHASFITLIPDVHWLDQVLSIVCEPPKFRNEGLLERIRCMTSERRHLRNLSRDVCTFLKQFQETSAPIRCRRNLRASLLCKAHVDWRYEQRKVSHPNVNTNRVSLRNQHRRLMDRSILSKKSYYNERVCLLIPELCEGTILITNSNETQQLNESSMNPSSTPSLLPSTEKPNLMHSSSVSQMPTKHPKQQQQPTSHPPQFTFPVEFSKTKIPTTQLQSSIPSVLLNSSLEPYTPIFLSQSPTFKDSLTQSSVAPSYPRNSRSCPKWRDSTKGERVQVAIVEFTYIVQITSLVATFLPDMEDLMLQVAADQTLNCQSLEIVRLSYPDPGSSLSICSPSIPEAQTCWKAISSIRVYYDESNISRENARRNVWNAIREEFDFGDRIEAIIPNQVQVELWEKTNNAKSTKHGWSRGDPSRLSVGASIGIVILLWTIIWAAGATIKVQLWRSSNKRRLLRRKNRSFRQTQGYQYYSNTRFIRRNLTFGNISKKSRHDIYHDNDKDEEQDWMVSDDEDDYEEENSDDYDDDDDDDDKNVFLRKGEYARNAIES